MNGGTGLGESKPPLEGGIRPLTILAVLGTLLVYCYLLTYIHRPLGLPSPVELASNLGVSVDHVFDKDGNVDSNLWIAESRKYENRYRSDDERLILFAIIAGAFLCSCFLPEARRRTSLVLWFLVGFLAIYGLAATSSFVASHLLIYVIFHPRGKHAVLASAGIGALFGVFFFQGLEMIPENRLLLSAFLGIGSLIGYLTLIRPSLRVGSRFASWLRGLIVHAPLLFCCLGALVEGLKDEVWKLPLGLLLFVWQWERLMVYHADFKDGAVPKDLPLTSYLSIFLNPAAMTNWTYSPYVGQAYSYLEGRYRKRDINEIVLGGVHLWGFALLYLLLGEWFVHQILDVAREQLGVTAYPFTTTLVRKYVDGTPTTTAGVLLTTLVYQVRVFVVFGAVTHFRVGAWRVFGYDVDPQYDRPWLATNLVTFWKRFAFHYREFLVRVFYYPIFLRFFKKNRFLRIFVATLVATSVGNHIWGHVPDKLYYRGLTYDNLIYSLRSWPYFLLLGAGIALTQLFLLRKGRTRRPWTPGFRVVFDGIAAFCTIQYFALISIFARPPADGTLWDSVRLFLLGLGIRIG